MFLSILKKKHLRYKNDLYLTQSVKAQPKNESISWMMNMADKGYQVCVFLCTAYFLHRAYIHVLVWLSIWDEMVLK